MKKILALVLALSLTIAMTVSVSAFEGSAEIALYVGNSVDWTFYHGDPVTVDGPGEYTFTFNGVGQDAENFTVVFIKDMAVENQEATASNLPSDIEIITKSLKINGVEIELTEGYPTTLNESGVFDVCYFNIWATSYFDNLGLGMVDTVEVTVEIKVPETEEAPAEDTTTEAPAEDTTEEAPADEEPADTGLALAVVPAIVALAAVALSKKR